VYFSTGEEFASRLSKEGAKYGLKGIVADPEECDMEDLTKISELEGDLEGPCLAVFCLATYGEGDPTDNAQEFFDWLQGSPSEVNGKKKRISIRVDDYFYSRNKYQAFLFKVLMFSVIS